MKSKLKLPDFDAFLNTCDILGVGETKTCEDDVILLPNYTYFPKHRKHFIRRSGGLGIFVKDSILPYIDLIEIDCEYLMLIKISSSTSTTDRDICIAFAYLPPEGSDYSDNDSFSEIETVLLPYIDSCKHFYIMGDLNARTGTTPEYTEFDIDRVTFQQYGIDDDVMNYLNNGNELQTHKISRLRLSRDSVKNNFGNRLLQLCRNNNLYICNGRINGDTTGALTCIKGSVIDYLICNLDGLLFVNKFCVHEYSPLFSDVHCAISFNINVSRNISHNAPVASAHKKWEQNKKDSFINNIDTNMVNELNLILENSQNCSLNENQIDFFAQSVKNIFHKSVKSSFKKYTFVSKKVKNPKPWFGLQCQKARKRFHAARKTHSVQKSDFSLRLLKNASKRYKATAKKFHAKYIVGLQNKIRKLRTERPKDYWKMINSLSSKNESIPVPLNDMFEYFKSLNSNEEPDLHEHGQTSEILIDVPNPENNEEFRLSKDALNDPISNKEINTAIKLLKLNKSSGIDDVLNEYIISTKHIFVPIYRKLFNLILENGIVPSDWVKGNIIPIYKNKGNKNEPNNYRPITLLSCIGKLFTSIINSRLTIFLEENRILNETQSGFRKEYSTIDNIMVLHSLIEYFKSQKRKLFCCFVDFTKAFDNIWRVGLWQKLLKHGIEGKIFKVITNMYNGIKSCITINGASSGYFTCEKGVRQGENLSPLLFAIYLNDLENFMNTSGCRGIEIDVQNNEFTIFVILFVILYADDTTILSDDAKEFQDTLNAFNEYCKRWKLKINISKTKIIIFGDYSRNQHFSFHIAGEEVEIIKEFKYLGVLFTKNGRFVQHVKNLSTLASKAMHLLRKRIVNLYLPVDCQLKLFDQTIVPILLYGSEVTGFENLQPLEKIHLDFMRNILKMKSSTPLVMVYGEFGRYPLEIQVKVRMIKFWSKLLTGKNSKISFKMYLLLLYLHRNNIYSCKWILYIEKILQDVGLNYIWLSNNVTNIKWLCREVQNRLQMQYIQKWNSDVYNSPKCINYRIFKTDFKTELYFTELQSKFYIPIARIRTTNHRLPIERGRWENIERSQRFCTLCNRNALGDEFHYLFECDFFKETRKTYLTRYYLRHANILKFQQLMSLRNVKLLQQLSRFISFVLSKF